MYQSNTLWPLNNCKPLCKKYKILLSVYKTSICTFVKKYPYGGLTVRYPNKLHIPIYRLDLFKRNLLFMAVRTYNKFQEDFKTLWLLLF